MTSAARPISGLTWVSMLIVLSCGALFTPRLALALPGACQTITSEVPVNRALVFHNVTGPTCSNTGNGAQVCQCQAQFCKSPLENPGASQSPVPMNYTGSGSCKPASIVPAFAKHGSSFTVSVKGQYFPSSINNLTLTINQMGLTGASSPTGIQNSANYSVNTNKYGGFILTVTYQCIQNLHGMDQMGFQLSSAQGPPLFLNSTIYNAPC